MFNLIYASAYCHHLNMVNHELNFSAELGGRLVDLF